MFAVNRFTTIDIYVTYSIAAVYEKYQMTANAVLSNNRKTLGNDIDTAHHFHSCCVIFILVACRDVFF